MTNKYPNIVNQLGFKEAGRVALGDLVLVEDKIYTRYSNAMIGNSFATGFSGGNFLAVTAIELDSRGEQVTISGGGIAQTYSNSWSMTLEANQDVLVLGIEDIRDHEGYHLGNMGN